MATLNFKHRELHEEEKSNSARKVKGKEKFRKMKAVQNTYFCDGDFSTTKAAL